METTATATATFPLESSPLRSLVESHCKARGCDGQTEPKQAYCPSCIENSRKAAEQMRIAHSGRTPVEQAEYMRMIGSKAYDRYHARKGR